MRNENNLKNPARENPRMKTKFTVTTLAAALSAAVSFAAAADSAQSFPAPASSRNTWTRAGQAAIADAKALMPNGKKAKNVILFIGDGMGISTITASRILAGQQPDIIGSNATDAPSSGEENSLNFEKFPYLALSKTYSVNQQTPDSAPTMTAMVTGVKTNADELSVDQATAWSDCSVNLETHALTSILEMAEDAGKSTGVVSTARITHATPAANYAHTTNRDWEADSNQPAGCAVPDIARQLLENPHGNGLEVAMGGGRTYFLPKTVTDPEYPSKTGKRADGHNLTAEWQSKFGPKSAYVWNKSQFDAIDPAATTHLLGLFEPSHMQYEADRPHDTAGEPSLADMTDKAIDILKKNRKGFYLHVEAGRIDHGHHAGNAYRALTDAIALSDAVQRAVDKLDAMGELDQTLIIVSADHSHTFTIAGYPQRGNNILGKVVAPGATAFTLADDKKPYTTLSYANGFGYHVGIPADSVTGPGVSGRVADMTTVDTTDINFNQEALVPLSGSETHAGEDVAIFAMGPSAHLFHGVMEQNVIFHVMKDAFRF